MSEEQGKTERELAEQLNAYSRYRGEARTIPMDKEVPQHHRVAIIETARGHMERNRIPMAQLAKEIGYSESVVSQVFSNTYRGDADKVIRAINAWLEIDGQRRATAGSTEVISTFAARTIRTMVMQALKRMMMLAMSAPSGCGKTMMMRVLAEQTRGILVICTHKMTEKELLAAILSALGSTRYIHTRGGMFREIIALLKGTKRPIFLDEAHQLGRALTAVRSIHDQCEVPIIMLGTADVLEFVNDRVDGRGQFSSRTMRCDLARMVVNSEDPKNGSSGPFLYSEDEIRAFLNQRGLRLADDGLKMAWGLANLLNYGGLRFVGHLVGLAADANPGVEALGRRHLAEALVYLVGAEAPQLRTLGERVEEGVRRTVAKVA